MRYLRLVADTELNLLTALDALLAAGSVAGAARRLGPSASAMNRTLARLRAATGDPLLVRAGKGMVPTPRAVGLRERVHDLTIEAQAVLRPAAASLDLAALERTFAIRASDGFVEIFAARLGAAATAVAPNARLRFAAKPDKNVGALREGTIDLEIGVLGPSGPSPSGAGRHPRRRPVPASRDLASRVAERSRRGAHHRPGTRGRRSRWCASLSRGR